MLTIRPAAVAGTFYPDDPHRLRAEVEQAIAAHRCPGGPAVRATPPPKAVVAPHAGYRYSGVVAGAAYAALAPLRGTVRRVVVLGPAHRLAFDGVAVPTVDAFSTPLGRARVDSSLRAAALGSPAAVADDAPHAGEHSLEVHLPFVQVVFGPDTTVLPIAVGRASAGDVADVLERVWGDETTAVVASSDLSHYHPYDEAVTRDDRTEERVLDLDLEGLTGHDACGVRPVAGLLTVARRLGLDILTLSRLNSGDTPQGDRSRVVGYGAWALRVRDLGALAPDEEDAAFAHAWASVRARLRGDAPLPTPVGGRLGQRQGCFVTLHHRGELRGCIGTLEHRTALGDAVGRYAAAAAFDDRRFAPLTEAELAGLEMDISLLGPIERVLVDSEAQLCEQLRPGTDGLVLTSGGRRGTLLPGVWEQVRSPVDFVRGVKAKAGLAADAWPDDLVAHRYTASSVGPRPAPTPTA